MFETEAKERQRQAGAAQGHHGAEGGRGHSKNPLLPNDSKGFAEGVPPTRERNERTAAARTRTCAET